jgi:hypothetical protein
MIALAISSPQLHLYYSPKVGLWSVNRSERIGGDAGAGIDQLCRKAKLGSAHKRAQ